MDLQRYALDNGSELLIREAVPEDAGAILEYLELVSGESDFLTFGPGEMTMTEEEEQKLIAGFHDADNQLFLLGQIDDVIVSTLTFLARSRPRIRHTGEFGMSVRKDYWGLGIGGLMLDSLIAWGVDNPVVAKINLLVRTDNRRAIRLYESKGFLLEGTISRSTCLNGTFFDVHHMGLEV